MPYIQDGEGNVLESTKVDIQELKKRAKELKAIIDDFQAKRAAVLQKLADIKADLPAVDTTVN